MERTPASSMSPEAIIWLSVSTTSERCWASVGRGCPLARSTLPALSIMRENW